MDLDRVLVELDGIGRIAKEWKTQRVIADIEREIVLAKLRDIYTEIKLGSSETMTRSCSTSCGEQQSLSTSTVSGSSVDRSSAVEKPEASVPPETVEGKAGEPSTTTMQPNGADQVAAATAAKSLADADKPDTDGAFATSEQSAGQDTMSPGMAEGNTIELKQIDTDNSGSVMAASQPSMPSSGIDEGQSEVAESGLSDESTATLSSDGLKMTANPVVGVSAVDAAGTVHAMGQTETMLREELLRRSRLDKRLILSLYGDEPLPEPSPINAHGVQQPVGQPTEAVSAADVWTQDMNAGSLGESSSDLPNSTELSDDAVVPESTSEAAVEAGASGAGIGQVSSSSISLPEVVVESQMQSQGDRAEVLSGNNTDQPQTGVEDCAVQLQPENAASQSTSAVDDAAQTADADASPAEIKESDTEQLHQAQAPTHMEVAFESEQVSMEPTVTTPIVPSTVFPDAAVKIASQPSQTVTANDKAYAAYDKAEQMSPSGTGKASLGDRFVAGLKSGESAPHLEMPHKKVLGETLAAPAKAVNEVLGEKTHHTDVASKLRSRKIADLRHSIGINDRFLLIRDLFGGDADLYERTISDLERFTHLDEAMIYIQEHFDWDPDSDGVTLLVELLECKLEH